MSPKARQSSRTTDSIIQYLNVPNALTTGNAICGMLSIFSAITGRLTLAAIFLLIAVLLDFLDGWAARRLGQSSLFGEQLDSLSDSLSFGVAPAVFGFMLGLDDAISIAVLLWFVSAGILRLARFNVSSKEHFIGVPITTNGYIFPAIYFLHHPFPRIVILAYAIMAVLMVSSIRIRKVLK